MRVVVVLTIDNNRETRIEGQCSFMGDAAGDHLEQSGLGIWLERWRYAGASGGNHKGRVFCPWTSVLYIEEMNGQGRGLSRLHAGL